MSKGSHQRPRRISRAEWSANWALAFQPRPGSPAAVQVKVTERGALRCCFEDVNGDECQLPLDHDGSWSDHEVGPERRKVERKFRRQRPGEHRAGHLVKGSENPADDGMYVEDDNDV